MLRSRAHRIGGQPPLAFAKFSLSPPDITWMPLYVCSRLDCLWLIRSEFIREKQKTLLTFVSRVEKILKVLPAYIGSIHIAFLMSEMGLG